VPEIEKRQLIVEDAAPDRLDRVLARAWSDLSRSRLQALIRQGHAKVCDVRVTDPAVKVAPGARIALAVPPAEPATPEPETVALDVVYEDDDVIVIDKPAGLVVHPAAGHRQGTLVNALIAHCGASLSGIGGVQRPGIVHRLDKDTSGLLVAAKNDRAHQSLSAQFADHGRTGPLKRTYRAVVWGRPDPQRGVIDAAIARSSHHRERMAVVPSGRGRHARTHYEIEEGFGADVASLVRCSLETGRTHQIRVHLAHIGHPLLGDAVYGAGFKTKANRLSEISKAALLALNRQALHAAALGFEHPVSGRFLRFESPVSADLAELLTALRAET
jgi:23S rRNA pseudouridine1911/1915/1917 synthase